MKNSFLDFLGYPRFINYRWDNKMRGMLGKEHRLLAVFDDGIIALPSPDGSGSWKTPQDGKLYFDKSVVRKSGNILSNVG